MAFDPSLSPALQGLLSRHSVGLRWMAEPGPSVEQLHLALRAALRAPDHRRLLPWRAVLIETQQRDALADRFEAFARAVGKSDDEVATERERAYNGPVLVAWIVRLTDEAPEVPRHEQWMSAGGALTNFLTALHLMGFGAKTLAGRKCTHPCVRDAFCGQGEQLAAFICIGTPTRAPQARDVDDPDAALTRWNEA